MSNGYISPWMDEDLSIFRKQQHVGRDTWRRAGAMGFLCTDVRAKYGGAGGANEIMKELIFRSP